MELRTAAAVAAVTVALSGVAAGTSAAAPGTATGSSAPASSTGSGAGSTGPAMTRLVYEVAGCEGCSVQLTSARQPADREEPVVWTSKVKQVEDGEVRFTVATRRTWGMTTTLEAPWEGQTGYVTNVVQRYRGLGVGDRVGFGEARRHGLAYSCWAGTRQDEVRTEVVVRRVRVAGVRGRVPGTIAFTRTTQDWQGGMRRAPGGVLGAQDVEVCR
ncbi:hypothetical protein [Nocardioides sp. Arc9.136]|uniref:hypothetical protein n=1 Tax=Nocardioides sp. Arc9.136 TaxID=2996826 RepID=UPI002666FF14|nr:hypothetical protein [Nocardioides sp. Arc9.136]WKN47068.1 hypothetical protein OSR43_13570 [Nocardioides sp. Arc9.136]